MIKYYPGIVILTVGKDLGWHCILRILLKNIVL